MTEFQVGDRVTAIYKTGKYIGEVTDIRPQHYLVRVLAVLKHPMQGDLHHPKDANVAIFHERKALAFREQANIPKQMVRSFSDGIPDYSQSLREAIGKMKAELKAAGAPWGERSLDIIYSLEKEYFK